MKQQKYQTEICLILCSQGMAALRPSEISKVLTNPKHLTFLENCHIYAIGKRSRLSIKPGSLFHDGEALHGQLCFHHQGQIHYETFSTYVQIRDPIVKFDVSAYPHNQIIGLSASGEVVHTSPITLVAPLFMGHYHAKLDVEIMYIGQAFGKKGGRHALNRLKDHSTLQKIQADILSSDPDSELLLILIEYAEPMAMLQIDGASKPIRSDEEDNHHITDILNTPIPDAELVTIAEAGLIRYFQPYYNTIYKDNFPETGMKTLQRCYHLDFSALSIEIDTEDLHFKVFSSHTQRHFHHIAMFDLHTEENRRDFFRHYGFRSIKSKTKSRPK